MKLRYLLLSNFFLFIFGMGLNAGPAEGVIKTESDKITLLAAIERISQEYEVYFTFDMTLVSDVEVEYEDRSYSSAEEAISHILKGTNLKYKFYDHRFVILYKEDEEGLESLRQMSRHLDGLISEGERSITSAPKREIRTIPTLSSKFLSREIQRIAFTVEGKVVDQDGEPLIGVNVQVKGNNKGTATDFDGKFILEDIDENDILVISYVGYQTQEISIAGKSNLEIVMVSDSQLLDEVVVVGYGTQKKTSLTAAVSSMKGEELKSLPTTNLSNNLAGRLSGVIAKQANGEPGRDGSSIYIRGISTTGSTSPLVIVDGVPRDFSKLDPNSIESFTILKDAAAVAPYGVAGANGVVLVTTKKGRSGKPRLNYNGSVGFQNPIILPNIVNGYEFALLKNVAAENEGVPLPYNDGQLRKYKDGSDPDAYPSELIWDALITNNALLHNHSFELSGGTDVVQYYGGVGYQYQDGMWATTNSNRYNLNMSLDIKATKTTNISFSLNGILNRFQAPPSDQAGGTTRIMELVKYSHIQRGLGMKGVYSNGMYGSFASGEIFSGGHNRTNQSNVYTQMSVDQELPFIKGLKFKGLISYDKNNSVNKRWTTRAQVATVDTFQYPRVITEGFYGPPRPRLNQNLNWGEGLTLQTGLFYSKGLKNHKFDLMGLFEARSIISNSFSIQSQNFNLYIDEVSMGSGSATDVSPSGSSGLARQAGVVFRGSYSYLDKYLLEASGRYDGHYYFAPGKKFGFFPAVSIGWRLSEEKYFKENFEWLDNLKIRASKGTVGALAGGAFQYLSAFGVSSPGYTFSGTGVQTLFERSEPNTAITWEKADKSDVGLEIGILKGVLDFEIDYFYEKRSNMLVPPTVVTPVEYGIGLSQENAGKMENRGVEFSLAFNKQVNRNWDFSIRGNLTYAKNKILEIFESAATYENPERRRTGRSLGTIFGYRSIGYFLPEDFDNEGNLKSGIAVQPWGKVYPGDIRYDDVNGDGKIDINDEVAIGDPTVPQLIFGISPHIGYKWVSLDLLFQGVGMTDFYYQGEATWAFWNGQTAFKENFDYWRPDNLDARFPRMTSSPPANNTQVSSHWVQNVNYVRLKNIILNFSLPSEMTRRLKMEDVSIFLSGQNILTWTNTINVDPEMTDARGNEYPQQKVISLGLNIGF